MNTQQLSCFLLVADRLNFTKAAEELFLSVPTVTHHIKTLEAELKTTLFLRNSKMVQLTEAGASFYEDAKEILDKIRLSEQKLAHIANASTFFLKIGCTSNAELEYLKEPLAKLHQIYPNMLPKIYVHDYFSLKKLFENHQIDLMLSTKGMVKNMPGSVFKQTRIAKNYAIFPADSPLRDKTELHLEDIKQQRLIILHPTLIPFQYSDRMRDQMAERAFSHQDILCDNDQVGLLLAECGFGIVVFPEFCIGTLPATLKMLPFEQNVFSISYGVTHHKKIRHDCIRDFLEIFY